MLSEEGGVELEIPRLLDDPSPLVFLAAITLQAANHEKQQFLESERITDLLTMLQGAYRREISILHAMKNTAPPGGVGRFSVN
jgi:hypothetical protein